MTVKNFNEKTENDVMLWLENIDLPFIEIASHRRKLRKALLLTYDKKVSNFFFWINYRKFASAGAAILITGAIVTSSGTFNPLNKLSKDTEPESKVVYAKEIITKSQETTLKTNLMPLPYAPLPGGVMWENATVDKNGYIKDENDTLIYKVDKDRLIPMGGSSSDDVSDPYDPITYKKTTFTKESFIESLAEANEATDLTYLGEKVLKDGRKVNILSFTDNEGMSTILGIDRDGLPLIRYSYNKTDENKNNIDISSLYWGQRENNNSPETAIKLDKTETEKNGTTINTIDAKTEEKEDPTPPKLELKKSDTDTKNNGTESIIENEKENATDTEDQNEKTEEKLRVLIDNLKNPREHEYADE